MDKKNNIKILKRIPFRWHFNTLLKNDLSQLVCHTRVIQAETRQEALEIARRFKWIKEIEESSPPNELSYSLEPEFEEANY